MRRGLLILLSALALTLAVACEDGLLDPDAPAVRVSLLHGVDGAVADGAHRVRFEVAVPGRQTQRLEYKTNVGHFLRAAGKPAYEATTRSNADGTLGVDTVTLVMPREVVPVVATVKVGNLVQELLTITPDTARADSVGLVPSGLTIGRSDTIRLTALLVRDSGSVSLGTAVRFRALQGSDSAVAAFSPDPIVRVDSGGRATVSLRRTPNFDPMEPMRIEAIVRGSDGRIATFPGGLNPLHVWAEEVGALAISLDTASASANGVDSVLVEVGVSGQPVRTVTLSTQTGYFKGTARANQVSLVTLANGEASGVASAWLRVGRVTGGFAVSVTTAGVGASTTLALTPSLPDSVRIQASVSAIVSAAPTAIQVSGLAMGVQGTGLVSRPLPLLFRSYQIDDGAQQVSAGTFANFGRGVTDATDVATVTFSPRPPFSDRPVMIEVLDPAGGGILGTLAIPVT